MNEEELKQKINEYIRTRKIPQREFPAPRAKKVILLCKHYTPERWRSFLLKTKAEKVKGLWKITVENDDFWIYDILDMCRYDDCVDVLEIEMNRKRKRR